jgi:hypothetical protein
MASSRTPPPPRLSRRVTLPLPAVEIRDLRSPRGPNQQVVEAVRAVFLAFDEDRMDLDALIFFALQKLDVTPDNHHLLVGVLRDHILTQYSISQGSLKERADLDIRRLWTHLHDESFGPAK